MDKEKLIERAYRVFSIFKKPVRCTKHMDLEDAAFNKMLLSATRRSLTIEQVGTIAWSLIPSMTPEALAYFMPRLIELAVSKSPDVDGDPFFCSFINSFYQGPDIKNLELFGPDQKQVMVEAFRFLRQRYGEQLENEGWFDEASQAVQVWNET
jgi:hypothetical protein